MARSQAGTSQIPLLKDITAVLLEGALFFIGDDKRAKKARARLENKDPDDAAFFGNLVTDLQKLGDTLQNIPDTWTDGQGIGNKSVLHVLDVIQKDFLSGKVLEEYESESESEEDRVEDVYASLKILLRMLKHPDEGPEDDYRISWLCERIKLERPKSKSRDALLKAVNKCYDALKGSATTRPADVSWRQIDPSTTLWETPLFADAERFHKALSDHWDCCCFQDHLHQKAQFSFDNLPTGSHACTTGTMYYTTEKDGCLVWKRARFQYQQNNQLLSPNTKPRLTKHAHLTPGHFCDILEASSYGDLISIADGVPTLQKANRDKFLHSGPPSTLDTAFYEHLPLTACFALPPEHSVFSMSPKRRMILALYLVYAYLHLGGGCWWPYDRRSSVQFCNEVTNGSFSPFFVATLLHDRDEKQSTRDNFDFLTRALNRDMPSLVALGRFLLELYVGHAVIWDKVDAELEHCAEDPFATEMVQVVRTCLQPSETQPKDEPRTIREDKTLYAHFVKEVILPIQYILQFGYQVKAQDVFAAPALPKLAEVASPRRLRSPTPVTPEGPQEVPLGFCLHDGQVMPRVEGDHAHSADDYMKRLKECNRHALTNELCSDHGFEDHVKIAILDTGVDISQEQLEHVYDDRVKECRTWLKSSEKAGDRLVDLNLDSDGHGTHGTSVLLEATDNTDIEVYVAQIFEGQSQKISQGMFVDDFTVQRIAKAITYAVDVWKVDIISMSFGFPTQVTEIDLAIEHARERGVLMVAAASNCGGNGARSWPAKDDRVVCVYATDGYGNKYYRNPNPQPHQDNFATLGCAVEALWPARPGSKASRVRKSGTSTATPICAAIAALVISVLRKSEDGYIAASHCSDLQAARLRADYQRRLEHLGRPGRMSNVLRLMTCERDGYQYVDPEEIFTKKKGKAMIDAILEAIDG